MLKNNQSIRVILLTISCIVMWSCKNISQRAVVVRDNQDTTTFFSSSTEQLKSNQIPDHVFSMSHLKHLSITGMDCDYKEVDKDGNDITRCWMIAEIPHAIINLKELESLQLNVHAIRTIPMELGDLKKLKSLDLTDNLNLSDVENVVRLENLEELGLNGCNLTKLPANIGQLKKLQSLGLSGNSIDEMEKKRIEKALPNCRVYF
jgi:Leucine-rich repeat (LRR) protein